MTCVPVCLPLSASECSADGVSPFRADAVYGAADEVGSRLLERVQEQLVGVGRQHVVAVDEGQELPAGALDAAVARASRAAVLFRLEQR